MANSINGVHLSQLHSSIFDNDEEQLQGQIQALHLTFAFASSMAVKAACLLHIPDILATEGALTLQEIASKLDSSSSDAPRIDYLERILRFLCCQHFFSFNTHEHSEPTYALTPISKWIVQDKSSTALFVTSTKSMAPWHLFSDCVLNGSSAFPKAHGMDTWSLANDEPDFNKLFNNAMACRTDFVMKCLLKEYHGFANVGTLVDVGGGVGAAASWITTHYPSLKAINLDLPHVIATAPTYPGVKHIGGDMFKSIPSADAIFIKWILHNWDDEDCIKILKNCRKAICDSGKLIIVEAILEPATNEAGDPFNQIKLVTDLAMMAHFSGGKERTKPQWEALLVAAGFPRYNVITLPSLESVLEAFPS